MKPYKIFAARLEDVHQGWVWLQSHTLPPRSVVKITNTTNGKSVYVEALQIDDNFEKEYSREGSGRLKIEDAASSLVLSDWYRGGLGGLATKGAEAPLLVRPANSLWGRLRACTGHPQIAVRLATWLGVIGVALGLISLIALWPEIKSFLLWLSSLLTACRST